MNHVAWPSDVEGAGMAVLRSIAGGRTVLAVALGLALLTSARAATANLPAAANLEVETGSGAHPFTVELARTNAERETGLMNRHAMADTAGMLFDFGRDQMLLFWMKDTYIPLDMVFIDHGGRVVSIKHDAKPLDETTISSQVPAAGVLEINAGVADKIGLKIGDEVRNPIFHDEAKAR